MMPFQLRGPILHPISSDEMQWFPNGALAINERGVILYCGRASDLPERFAALKEIQTDLLLVPGFIDLHVHLPQYDCRGKFGTTLLEWLERFAFPEEARFANETVARDTSRRFFEGLLHAGTTTAMVFSSVHARATQIAFGEAEHSKLRIIMGKVQMDRDVPQTLLETTEQSLNQVEELISTWHRKTDRLWYAVTPRFAPSCTPTLLRKSAQLAERYGTYIQTHINESHREIERVHELYPTVASYTDVYHEAGLLTPLTILAHNIHATDAEMSMCETLNCGVAHCPDSNLFLGSGRFPLERYQKTTIRFGLGSDVGAGTTLNMLSIMRSMSHAQKRSLHPFLPFYLATLGGARALSLAHRVGNFLPGKEADIAGVKLDQHFCAGKSLRDVKPVDIASALVYRAQPSDVQAVWVQGERLL